MRIRKFAAAGVAIVALGAFALPTTPAGAQEEPEIVVQKLVLGETDTTEFEFTVECDDVDQQVDATPAGISDPFTLTDGQRDGVTESVLNTDFEESVGCQVVETALGTAPGDAWVVITTSNGDIIEATPGEVPIGADFAWDFTTLPEFVQSYDVLVVNDYTTDGTAAELCAVVVEQAGELANLIDSFGDIDTLTPEQLADLFEVSINLFLAGGEVAPADISGSWDAVTVAYIQLGQILSEAGFDAAALTEGQIASIEAIFTAVAPDVDAVVEYLATSCVVDLSPSSTTTTTTAAVAPVAAPRYTG